MDLHDEVIFCSVLAVTLSGCLSPTETEPEIETERGETASSLPVILHDGSDLAMEARISGRITRADRASILNMRRDSAP
ncbi:hypothetical protein [Qipengyuania sp. YIM B01966]|uniref:hypothetical protein n=1 Tax=Qipengyuania sp. YIM B01966 TaxID=2778646 RepID=UPI000DB19C90|nr:hypothetical protein [Qipengyuania sp. YIM B01966]PZU16178.1 MAG: hypothetical protein DI591_07640 [Citromicrobium sp.]